MFDTSMLTYSGQFAVFCNIPLFLPRRLETQRQSCMVLLSKKIRFFYRVFCTGCWFTAILVAFLCNNVVLAQKQPSRVDQLSDEQVQEFYRRAQSSGLNEMQIEQAAMSQGYTLDDVAKMRRRIAQIRTQTNRSSTNQTTGDSIVTRSLPANLSRRNTFTDSLPTFRADTTRRPIVFGASLFQNASLSFEPNLRIATPRGYIVGPDDEIIVDIFGASSENYKLRVNPEGTVKVLNLAPIFVAGLTIEQAEKRIIGRLQQAYSGLGRAGSGTSATISLGQIRSIHVTILGEVVKPGTYNISSLGSAFNALYLAGGPNPETGSFRRINIIRGNRVVRTIDLYDFLLRADQKDNIRLQDQDVIRIADYETRIEFAGQVRRPAIYELLPGETLKTALGFAGGFTDEAYTASIKLRRNTPRERKIFTVTTDELATFVAQRGDRYEVGKILERYENRVQIAGAIMRPGEYALEPGLTTVKELILRAEGLRKDAFLNRASIIRERPDMDMENISFDVSKLLRGEVADIALMRQDSVVIQSIRDLRETYTVNIEGAINKPGLFTFVNNMSVSDLITQAGGFRDGASATTIEVARRVMADSVGPNAQSSVQLFKVSVGRDLGVNNTDKFTLQPFDIVSVYSTPYYEGQQRVFIGGEVLQPGFYAVANRTERISDLIRRSGGLKKDAYLPGAQFYRQGSVVATDLRLIIDKPDTEGNFRLEERDSLLIPKRAETVEIRGAVLNPTAIAFETGFTFDDYIDQAGGFTENARRSKAYVTYPNGQKDRTRRFLYANFHPKVQPGSVITVPFRPTDSQRLSPAERVGLYSVMGSLAAVMLTIIRLL
jgi:polysaccharide biosynthesis/export protein